MKENRITPVTRKKLYAFFPILIALYILLGVVSRLSPLYDLHGRLLSAPCDDGYYTLTVARNIALEKGMSTSNGAVSTNGIQPLCTFIYSIFYWLVSGDKTWSLVLILIYQAIISILAAAVMYYIVKALLVKRNYGNNIAVLSSSIWFASSWAVLQSTNFLETGTYVLLLLLSIGYFFEKGFPQYRFTSAVCVKLGILLGLTFLCRNDAIFLVFGIFFFLLIKYFLDGEKFFFQMSKRLFIVGMAFTSIASPWLLYNQLYFGSIVPISGQGVEDADIFFNLRVFPKAVLENFVLSVPDDFDFNKPGFFVAVIYLLLLSGIIVIIKRAKNFSRQEGDALLLMSFFFFPLSIYYITLSTSYYFFARYLFVFSPFFTVLAVSLLYIILSRFRSTYLFNSAVIILFAVFLLMNIMLFKVRADNGHTNPANWVRKNVPADVLVGAFQSGTIGYFHDNTINLDGVVNPYALKAIQYDLKHNLIPDKPGQSRWYKYVRDQNIKYLVDWGKFLLDFSGEEPKSAIEGYKLIYMSHGFAVLEKDGRGSDHS